MSFGRILSVLLGITSSGTIAQAYEVKIIDCPKFPLAAQDVTKLKGHVEAGVSRFKTYFPLPEDFVVETGYVCNNKFMGGMGSHRPETLATPDTIAVLVIHPDEREAARASLRQELAQLEKLDTRRQAALSAQIDDFLDWKLADFWPEEVVFHELVHLLNDRSDLNSIFSSLIEPAFEDLDILHKRKTLAIVESFRPELTRRLLRAGFPAARLGEIGVTSEGRNFKTPLDCASEVSVPGIKASCQTILEYNAEIASEKQVQFADSARALMFTHALPHRHAFDGHVFASFNPRKSVYDEEFLTISADSVFYPFRSGFYTKMGDDPRVKKLRKFWLETPFKNTLKLAPSKREYYLAPDRLSVWMNELESRFPARTKILDLSTLTGVGRTARGNLVKGLKISAVTKSPERRVLIDAGHHSDEALAVRALIDFVELILIENKYPSTEFYVVPALNEDGHQIVFTENPRHRLNARNTSVPGYSESGLTTSGGTMGSFGVDLNRNYPSHGWASMTGSTYKGPFPLSETETQLIDRLTTMVKFDRYISLHNAGNELLCPRDSRGRSGPALAWCWSLAAQASEAGYELRETDTYGQSIEYLAIEKAIPSVLIEIGSDKDKREKHAPNATTARREILKFLSLIARVLE